MKLPSHFYAIVDPIAGHDPVELARTMLEAGVRVMQLRLKDVTTRDFLAAARAISQLCHRRDAIFIVNDRIDVAMLSDADGVHLGQNDLPLDAGRELLGPDKIIGVSTSNVELARAAEAGGADYIGFGPMYPGGLKNTKEGRGLERLAQVRGGGEASDCCDRRHYRGYRSRGPWRRRRRRRDHHGCGESRRHRGEDQIDPRD